MRLIWSALWGAFPREIHLISEFLIPSLRGPVLAPFATPQEVEGARGGRGPHAKGEEHSSLAAPGPHLPGASPNCLRLGGVWSLGSGPGPCLQYSGSHASAFPHPDRKLWARERGNWKRSRRVERRAGTSGGSRKGLHEHFTSCTIYPEMHLVALSTSRAWLGLAWDACVCVYLGCGGGSQRGPCFSHTYTWQCKPWAEQALDSARVRPAAAQQPGGRQGLEHRESLAGNGAETAKERRSTRKIYWADQMHRGG